MNTEPFFVGHNPESGFWTFAMRPDDSCKDWWDIKGWTWDDCVSLLNERNDSHRYAVLALSPKVR